MRISDWSSDVCSSDLGPGFLRVRKRGGGTGRAHPGSLPRRGGHAALQASAAEGRGHLAQGVRRRIAALGAQPTAEGAHRHLHQNFDWSRVAEEARRACGQAIGARLEHDHQVTDRRGRQLAAVAQRSEEHTSELQSLMRISYAVFCLKKKKHNTKINK